MTLIEVIEYYQSLMARRRNRLTREAADEVLKAMGVNKTIRKHVAATVSDRGKLIRTFSKTSH